MAGLRQKAHVQGANIVGLNWLYSHAVGGLRLQVSSGDATEARNIQRALDQQDTTSGSHQPRVPQIGELAIRSTHRVDMGDFGLGGHAVEAAQRGDAGGGGKIVERADVARRQA